MEKNHTVKDHTYCDGEEITECALCNSTLTPRETYVYIWGIIYRIPVCEKCYTASDLVVSAYFAGYNAGYNGF